MTMTGTAGIDREKPANGKSTAMTRSITDSFPRDRAALAPLAGVTDSVFRRLCVRFGAAPVMTEMVSSDGYARGPKNSKTARMLEFHESERPLGVQFFGSDPDIMAQAAARAVELAPDFIDINAGCPVRKVVGRGAGSALLQRPRHLAEIVRRTVEAAGAIPVTVKIRAGWDHDAINATEVARLCVDAGAAALIVHPRTRSRGFSGIADHSITRAVVEAVDVPVIASGDITSAADVLRVLDETGAYGIMIGRRAMGDPWIFERVRAALTGAAVPPDPELPDRLDLGLRQLAMLAEEVSERYAVLNMRKSFGWYSKGARGGSEFRQMLFRANTMDEAVRIVRDFRDSFAAAGPDHETVPHETVVS